MIFRKLWLSAVIMTVLTGCNADGQVKLTQIYQDFSFVHPVDFQVPPDDSKRVMIVDQPGRIYAIQNGAVATMQTLLDITDSVTSSSTELGLLGLVFHPHFKDNGYFYVDYTAPNPLRTVIARFTESPAGSNSVKLSSRVVLLEIPQPFENHKGGCLAFGPDGDLYIGLGDGGSAGDPYNNAQNTKVLLGKILRINVDSAANGKNYSIPASNPFAHSTDGSAGEIYAYGLRNPWRFSFDRTTGRLWVGDVGQDKYEEIDTVGIGKNYGWRIMEGTHCYNPDTGCNQTGLTPPIIDYAHDANGGDCVIGGYVYRGKKIPSLYGKYLYADEVVWKLWSLTFDVQGKPQSQLLIPLAGSITTFGIDADSELYVCTYDSKIYRIDQGSESVGGERSVVNDFQLEQNFPNPFNGDTAIPFHLRSAAHAMLAIYDELGKKVATLVDAFMQPGSYTVRWNADRYASGIYTCQLTADGETATRQIILQK